ncbi:RNA methyltransferase [Sporobolomyces salmoneus]|uniref:RNA methyltransferase n=1 Tax=Sporobolomyces salmoneus TaxID=183962 RepID=UPI003175154F
MMRPGRKHNSILNSPIVRGLINPVKTIIPSSSTSSQSSYSSSTTTETPRVPTGVNPYLSIIAQERGEELPEPSPEHLIPTQPIPVLSTHSDPKGKGKKRARSEEDNEREEVEWDERAGTRFGVVTRYSEENLPRELEKYWAQRYRLFSRFDEGCEMDREGWYSVTPENIAIQIAERCRSGVIVDAFCGVGGNAISFAFTCEKVIAFDTSKVRLACAKRNAEIYGVADRITFIHADWVTWTKEYIKQTERGEIRKEDEIEVIFLSPPWGGISYQTLGTSTPSSAIDTPTTKKRRIAAIQDVPPTPTPQLDSSSSNDVSPPAYPLSALAPLHGAELLNLASQVTPHIAYYLPRNVDLIEVANLSPLKPGESVGGKRERVEVEEEWMSGKLKAVTAYYGGLVVGAGGDDREDTEDSEESE